VAGKLSGIDLIGQDTATGGEVAGSIRTTAIRSDGKDAASAGLRATHATGDCSMTRATFFVQKW
jgi:hypothetical protein